MDDFSLRGEDLERTLESLERVNGLLGGNRVLLAGVASILEGEDFSNHERSTTIVDLGCGGGDGLRALAHWGRVQGRKLRLKGIDANPFVVEYAHRRSAGLPDLSFETRDVLDLKLETEGVDVVTLNLCLHHFDDDQIRRLLHRCQEERVRAVVVNDLHRHWLAYQLFRIFAWVMRFPRIAQEDGLVSIRRGFRKAELVEFLKDLPVESYRIRWCWAFRYQLVIAFE